MNHFEPGDIVKWDIWNLSRSRNNLFLVIAVDDTRIVLWHSKFFKFDVRFTWFDTHIEKLTCCC